MLKLIGAISIMCSAFLYALDGYFTLSGRRKLLLNVQNSIKTIEMRLRCLCMPLDCCFEDTDEIFSLASKLIGEGVSPENAVITAAEKQPLLQKDDVEIFKGFAKGLCSDDCEGQLSNLRLFSQRIENAVKNAENAIATRGKLRFQGSILLGAAVVIILI